MDMGLMEQNAVVCGRGGKRGASAGGGVSCTDETQLLTWAPVCNIRCEPGQGGRRPV